MNQALQKYLSEALADSTSPVERDIAELLRGEATSDTGAWRLQRYHRKIDVALKLMSAYDDRIEKPTSRSTVSSHAYLGLALVFTEAARRRSVERDEQARSDVLRWVNSACNCLDHAELQPEISDVESELQRLLEGASAA